MLSFLNEDEISSLIPFAINFDNNQSPLFEYGKFIKKVAHSWLVEHVKYWLVSSFENVLIQVQTKRSIDQVYIVEKLVCAIYHMLMRTGSNLREFAFEFWDDYVYFPNISTFTTYKPGITNLRSLIVNINANKTECQNIVEFLSMIPNFCNGIVDFELWIPKLSDSFSRLLLDMIKLQPLENLLIRICNIIKKEDKNILRALEFRSDTLKELSFQGLDFKGVDLSFMSKLNCLERLEFDTCRRFVLQYNEILFKKKFHLKELNLWCDENHSYDYL